jgi:hypothetical protein
MLLLPSATRVLRIIYTYIITLNHTELILVLTYLIRASLKELNLRISSKYGSVTAMKQ